MDKKLFKNIELVCLYLMSAGLWILNFIRIFDNEFWMDEVYSIHLLDRNYAALIEKVAVTDSHPPFYYLFLKTLVVLFGEKGWVYHLSAFIPYTIIVILGLTLVRKYFGTVSAFVMIAFSSFTTNAVVYNVEVRMYALTAMFDLIAFIALYKILTTNKISDWVVFTVASLGTAYSQYYALISVAFLYACLLLKCIKDLSYIKRTLICYGATILLYCPWLVAFLPSFGRHQKGWWLQGIPGVKEFPLFLFDHMYFVVIFVAVVLIFFIQNRKQILSGEGIWIIAGLLSAVGTTALGLFLSHMIRPLFLPRYIFPSSAIIYLIFGYCISQLKYNRAVGYAVVIVLLIVSKRPYTLKFWSDYYCDKNTKEFMEMVQPSDDAAIYANKWLWDNENLDVTVLDYYYPNQKHGFSEEISGLVDHSDKEVWIFWSEELTEDQLAEFEDYSIEKFDQHYFATADFHVYKLISR